MPHIPNQHHFTQKSAHELQARVSPVFISNLLYYPFVIESLCLYLLCLSAALLCYTGFQNFSLIRSTSCSCSTCCFDLGFQLQNLQDFIKITRALIKDIFLGGCGRGVPSPTPQRALLRAGFACCGGGLRVPRGGPSCLGVGRPGLGALPSPTTRPFGRAAGAHYPLAVGAGVQALGPGKVLVTSRCANAAEENKKPRKRRTTRKNKAQNRFFRPQKPPKKFYAAVGRGRKI